MAFSRRGFVGALAAAAARAAETSGTLVDLGPDCLLRESLEGYRAAIAGDRISFTAGRIIPGAASSAWPATGRVLLECALGLVEKRTREAPYLPYVDFTWPVRAKIREFFPFVLGPRAGDVVIGEYVGAPVALRRGNLILLGSPIGPALAAGDPDARRWLAAVCRWMGRRT